MPPFRISELFSYEECLRYPNPYPGIAGTKKSRAELHSFHPDTKHERASGRGVSGRRRCSRQPFRLGRDIVTGGTSSSTPPVMRKVAGLLVAELLLGGPPMSLRLKSRATILMPALPARRSSTLGAKP